MKIRDLLEANYDQAYAVKWWETRRQQTLKQIMSSIAKFAAKGEVYMTTNTPFNEEDKEKLAAYRVAASQMGYQVGGYTSENGTARATITKAQATPSQRDLQYAHNYWLHHDQHYQQLMKEYITKAATGTGSVGALTTAASSQQGNPSAIVGDEKENLSAIRVMAQQMGYQVGDFVYKANGAGWYAPISKPNQQP